MWGVSVIDLTERERGEGRGEDDDKNTQGRVKQYMYESMKVMVEL